eukprot:TRINITY_DN3266_c0_g1_i7.p1 TRINITY_DN3266_c0_g1~~TRINITY_DN3266_c0_g1_i7.p1  ORF type:complete len:110 (-),score=15.86 TRINITY_DN3266_c0_g1_i7:78-407(-)
MGDCDSADNIRSRHSCQRICRKCWHSVLFFILDSAIINSWILSERMTERLNFIHDVALSLIGTPASSKFGVAQTRQTRHVPDMQSTWTKQELSNSVLKLSSKAINTFVL